MSDVDKVAQLMVAALDNYINMPGEKDCPLETLVLKSTSMVIAHNIMKMQQVYEHVYGKTTKNFFNEKLALVMAEALIMIEHDAWEFEKVDNEI